MQIDSESKIIYVHIPRTGGSWFTYRWPSHRGVGKILLKGKEIVNVENGRRIATGRHGRLSGIKEKLEKIDYDYKDHKIITLVRDPYDRAGSSWVWFSKVKGTAEKHGWKTIDDMLDEFEGGGFRVNYIPQTYWLEEQGAKFDHIYRFEDLLGDSSMILKDFPKFNFGKRDKDNLGRMGQVRSNMLTPKQRQRIQLLYKDDFKFLESYYPK